MSTTIIHELFITEKEHRYIQISDNINVMIKEKYNSDLGFLRCDDEGFVFFGGNDKSWPQRDIRTDLMAEEIAKILLEYQKEYELIGNFTYTSIYVNGIKGGTVFLQEDKAILYEFEHDPSSYEETNVNHTPFMKIVTL